TKPDQLSFGVAALAAALHSTPERVQALVRAGAIRAEFVERRGPRWSPTALAEVIKQLFPVERGEHELATQRAAIALSALERAYEAEKGVAHG
ncbi:hypothetical protein, partial [Aquabacterium sp. UBA2148]|uniref:hypothetical protein n=1 Tax=Aquabacterium sp. UBA2148 TaxID=1946042 RepID=UPI002579A85D